MNDAKQEWFRTQLHWDDKETIRSRKIPKAIVFNWRKMTRVLRSLCEEKHLSQDGKLVLVDIGCGAGKFHDGLESAVGLYIGVDPSDRMLSYASATHGRLFIRGVGEHLPLRNGIADAVVLKSVLDQCYAPHQVILEAYRVLKNGGWLLISLSNRSAHYMLFRRLYNLLRRHKGGHFFQESHQFYFNITDIAIMLRKEDFEVIRWFSTGYFLFPRCLEWLIPERTLPRIIDFADRIGSAILPQMGGIFILVSQRR